MTTAKVFWTGRSQAVRLPKEFRFELEVVSIRSDGRRVILEPVADDWAWLDAIQGEIDDDFVRAAEAEVPQQERPELDDLFK